MMASFFVWLLFAVATVPIATTLVPTAIALYAPEHITLQLAEQKPHVRALATSAVTVAAYPIAATLNWTFSWLFSPLLFATLAITALIVNVNTRIFAERHLAKYDIDVAPLVDWVDYVASIYSNRAEQLLKKKEQQKSAATTGSVVSNDDADVIDDHDRKIYTTTTLSEPL